MALNAVSTRDFLRILPIIQKSKPTVCFINLEITLITEFFWPQFETKV